MASRSRSSSTGVTSKPGLKSSRKASASAAGPPEQGDSETENESALCGDCGQECKVTDKALFCYMCERWFHAKCQKVSDEMYEVISKDSNSPTPMIFWYCKSSCSLFARKVVNSMCDLKKGLETVRSEVEQTSSRVEKIEKGKLTTELKELLRK